MIYPLSRTVTESDQSREIQLRYTLSRTVTESDQSRPENMFLKTYTQEIHLKNTFEKYY